MPGTRRSADIRMGHRHTIFVDAYRLGARAGALALALAEGVDASPAYAKGKLARELREILVELAKAELSPANLSLLEGVDL